MAIQEEGKQKEFDELAIRFTYHPPSGDQPRRYEDLRRNGYTLAGLIVASCPESRERALALTKLEEAIMWANAAIARRELPEEVV